jgi:heme/copper-type cytochrome/quinol oxidase subunit 2
MALTQGYDNGARSVGRLPAVILAASEAFSKTFGLIVTFGGIGVVVNVLLIYIAVQVRGEHRQNEELLNSRRPPES